MKELIKVCKNGTKIYKEECTCDRCQGRGWYAIGVHNGQLVATSVDNAVCYKCHGTGKAIITIKEFTPEHEAELKAKAERKQVEAQRKAQEYVEAQAKAEAERKAKEEAERVAKYESHKYVGKVGDKMELQATYLYKGSFDTMYGTTYVYTFEDADGNRFVWKTSTWLSLEENTVVNLKGTLKEHSEYNDIRQNVLTRCKIQEV